jgi:hypothetical protein
MPFSQSEVSNFLGAYFHQDWTEESSSWEQVAAQYSEDAGALLTQTVAGELLNLSESHSTESELSAQMQALGCYYWPGSDAGYRPWLKELAAHMLALAANNSLQARRP